MTGNGPQETSNNGYSRRREDRQATGIKRNLDWQPLPTDIELFEQSPLVIADALASPDSALRLTPATAGTPRTANAKEVEQSTGANVTSIQSLQTRKEHGGHSNLLTRHTATELRERCKKQAVRHALVKKPGEQRLYLAVGMLEWTPTNGQPLEEESVGRQATNKQSAVCSPLLFYPVHLVTEENKQSESGYIHSIRNDNDLPEFNYQLASELRNQRGITLPVFQSSQTLAEFLELISHCVATHDDVVLALKIELGLAKAPAGITSKTQNSTLNSANLPTEFDVSLAQKLISGMDMQQLRATLRLLTAANDIALMGDDAGIDLPETPDINEVHEYSVILHTNGLGNTRFQDLPELPEQIEQWCECIEPLATGHLVKDVLEQENIEAISLFKITGILELLDRAPADIEAWNHPDLAFSGTPLLFKRAKYQARLIEEELNNLKDHFHLDRVPPKHQLLQLLDELSGAEGQQIEVVDSDYFHARRRFMELSLDKPTTLTDFHKRQLNKLVKVLRFRELFVNNSEYRLALGPAYRGLRTDWDALETNIEYVQEISKYLASESLAAQIVANWKEFNRNFIAQLDDLQLAGRNLHRLLQLCTRKDANKVTSEFLLKMKKLATRLRHWNNDYGLITNYGDKTPAMLLGIFTGRQSLDKKTEQHVHVAKNLIKHYMVSQSKLSSQSSNAPAHRVQSTLKWLNEASTDDTATIDVIEAVLRNADSGKQPDKVI